MSPFPHESTRARASLEANDDVDVEGVNVIL